MPRQIDRHTMNMRSWNGADLITLPPGRFLEET
jgi:hypothetical protein